MSVDQTFEETSGNRREPSSGPGRARGGEGRLNLPGAVVLDESVRRTGVEPVQE